eukprot:TRINITY_DN5674_c0_g1_i16.p1 TRINITY_DN5674_c0_g1~~TRINITY_DN5674_c0_g1_i16.p1  ORF type:complete len:289 (+),score=78.12 TRINITY_DN5674_c0_g1_i16:3-869(+)
MNGGLSVQIRGLENIVVVFFFSSRRRHTRSCLVSWARRCVQETGVHGNKNSIKAQARTHKQLHNVLNLMVHFTLMTEQSTQDSSHEIFLIPEGSKYSRKNQYVSYLGGRIKGDEINFLAQSLEDVNKNSKMMRYAYVFLRLSLFFLVCFVSLSILPNLSFISSVLCEIELALWKFIPFLLSVLCFVLFLSLFMFSSIVEKKNLLQYMKKLNHSSFMARGLQISMVSDGVIRISLSLQVFLQLQREKVQKQTKKPIRVHHDKEKSESSSLASNPVESVQTKLTSTEIQG